MSMENEGSRVDLIGPVHTQVTRTSQSRGTPVPSGTTVSISGRGRPGLGSRVDPTTT